MNERGFFESTNVGNSLIEIEKTLEKFYQDMFEKRVYYGQSQEVIYEAFRNLNSSVQKIIRKLVARDDIYVVVTSDDDEEFGEGDWTSSPFLQASLGETIDNGGNFLCNIELSVEGLKKFVEIYNQHN